MQRNLQATLTRARDLAPLATIEGLPGGGAELTPTQLRALAAALTKIADDCEARPTKGKHLMAARREYRVE